MGETDVSFSVPTDIFSHRKDHKLFLTGNNAFLNEVIESGGKYVGLTVLIHLIGFNQSINQRINKIKLKNK